MNETHCFMCSNTTGVRCYYCDRLVCEKHSRQLKPWFGKITKQPSPIDLVHISQNFFYVAETLLQNGDRFLVSGPDSVLIRNLFQRALIWFWKGQDGQQQARN